MKRCIDSHYHEFGAPYPPIPRNVKLNNECENSSTSSHTPPPSLENSTKSNSSVLTKFSSAKKVLALMPEWYNNEKLGCTKNYSKNLQVSKPTRMILFERPQKRALILMTIL